MNCGSVYMLAIAPHPFDNDWGIAGMVAGLTKQGKDVVYVVCTNGDKATSNPDIKAADLAKIRQQEQTAAAKVLGVKEVVFLNYPDLGLEYTPEFRKEILRLILKYQPNTVVTCDPCFSPYMSNPDHRVTGRVVLDAVWPYALAPNTYRDLLDEGLKLHKVQQVLLWQTEVPDYRADITQTFDTKMEAVLCHQSQVSVLNPGWIGRTRERAAKAAEGSGFELAEPFKRFEVLQRL